MTVGKLFLSVLLLAAKVNLQSFDAWLMVFKVLKFQAMLCYISFEMSGCSLTKYFLGTLFLGIILRTF